MKKLIAILMATVMILALLTGCGSSSAPAENKTEAPAASSESTAVEFPKVTWRMSLGSTEASSWYAGMQRFAAEVNEKTGGNITIELYSRDSLSGGNMVKSIEMVQAGAYELDLHAACIWSGVEPKCAAVNLPFLFSTPEQVDATLGGEGGQMIIEAVEARGLHFLGWGENGFRQVTSNKKLVKSPADLVGQKMRTPTIDAWMQAFKLLGADPVAMNSSEVYTALQQGTVDGQENPVPEIYAQKWYEVQKYCTMWNYAYDAILLTMNQAMWDSCSPELQQILTEAAENALSWQRAKNREDNENFTKELTDAGYMEFYYPTDEEMKVFREAIVGPVYDEQAKVIGQDLIDAMVAGVNSVG